MATSLSLNLCGDACKEEAEYLMSFKVTSLEMTDADKEELFSEVLIVIAWDGNVVKLMTSDDSEEFKEKVNLLVHASPENLSMKLKRSPIMFNLSRGCNELGNIKLPLSDCFSDAVMCEDFGSQAVSNEFKFVKEGEENATINVSFRIEKLPDDEITKRLYKTMISKLGERIKKIKKRGAKEIEENEIDSDDEFCEDFQCPDEMPQHCKQDLGLSENVYRIINGNLINVKNKIGPCGEKCPVARKYIKELCTSPPENLPLSNRYDFKDDQPKCRELFKTPPSVPGNQTKVACPDCGGRKLTAKSSVEKSKKCHDDTWIDRNIQEEDLLKKLCSKYGINVDEVRAIGQKTKKVKKPKKNKVKKAEKTSLVPKLSCLNDEVPQFLPTREKFIKTMKRKARGRYSYDFGNEYQYPTHRSCMSVEKGAGDADIVPKFMGWRWDELIVGSVATKWFPGRINKTVRCLMKHLLNPFPLDTIPLTRRDRKGKVMKICNDLSQLPEFDSDFVQKPTLQIKKRDGEISIILNPLKDNKKLETDCNPYLNCSPLKFKIKKHPEEIKKHRAKKLLHERGFRKKCSCIELKCCRCMSLNEKKLLAYEMQKVSAEMKLKNCLVFGDLDESSDSEMDVEFTTPAAIIDNRKFKPDVIHCGTQYAFKDFLPSKFRESEKMVKCIEKPKLKTFKAPAKPKK